MKIGRNEPCPCGSGKKYKKCCLNKETNYLDIINNDKQDNDVFPCMDDKVKRLIPILKEYAFFDLIKSIFCVNSWIVNRSALCNAFALNKSLTLIKNFGTKEIKTYKEFCEFFLSIQDLLKIDVYDDKVCNDFGEIKLNFNNKFYSVIIGTGHSSVFGVLQFLPNIAKQLNLEYILTNILEYTSFVINMLSDVNISPYNDTSIRFDLPSEQFFEKIDKLFYEDKFHLVNKEVVEVFSKGEITKRHFIFYNGKSYPLFNPSILVDLYSYFLSKSTSNQIKEHIKYTIANKINSIFNSQDKKRMPICPVLCYVIENNKISCKQQIAFIAQTKKRVILTINESAYDNENALIEEIQNIETLHSQGNLAIVTILEKNKLLKINKNIDLQIVIYNDFTDVNKNLLVKKYDKYWSCSALDLVELICFVEDIDELSDFIFWDLHKKEKIVSVYTEKLNNFFIWKNNNRQLSHGAYINDMITIFEDYAKDMILKYYKEDLSQYPFHLSDSMFSVPFSYIIKPNTENKFYISKREKLCGGVGISLKNGCFIYMMNNLNLYDIDNKNYNLEKINFIEQINSELFKYYLDEFEKIDVIKNKLIQISFFNLNYAKQIDNNGFTHKNNKYVFSDIGFYGHYIIRYTINEELFIEDVSNAKDKSVENTYFLELLEPLFIKYPDDFKRLKEKIKNDFPKNKTYSIEKRKLNYYISDKILPVFKFSKENLVIVRKIIAEVCKTLDIPKGKFINEEATKIIRKIQIPLFRKFEEILAKYDKQYLHEKALSLYSVTLLNIEKDSYRINNESNVSNIEEYSKYTKEFIEDFFEQKTIRDSLIYLIETNLSIKDDIRKNIICSDDELNFCLCFAHWLNVLQNNSDFCHFNKSDLTVEISNDYRVSFQKEDNEIMETLKIRSSNKIDYEIKYDEKDNVFINDAKNAFLLDTGLVYDELILILKILSLDIPLKLQEKQILPNVFCIDIETVVKEICKICSIKEERIIKIFDFICLNSNLIRQINGKKENILPIWQRKEREHRFIIKPAFKINNCIIFSPITIKSLITIWINTLVSFYPPYEINLTNLVNALKTWKKRYEKEIVNDVFEFFKLEKLNYVEKEVKLHKRDKKGNHPESLGDYDVIAVDKNNKILYLIECKFIHRVGSTNEFIRQQKKFFIEDKYDEKFQKRINYMKENYEKFFLSQNLKLDSTYTIKSFMITNKIFYSLFKKIEFEILTLEELKKLIK